MPAINEITNKSIQTSAYSEQGRKNHEAIFAKKSAHEWAKEMQIRILDGDGFRWGDGITMDTPISHSEFQKRLIHCTINCGLFIQKADQFPHLFK